jgi:hypothetical protein
MAVAVLQSKYHPSLGRAVTYHGLASPAYSEMTFAVRFSSLDRACQDMCASYLKGARSWRSPCGQSSPGSSCVRALP